MTCRLLTLVFCVLAVVPPDVCTCAATAVECHDARCVSPVFPPASDDAHHCCCHGHDAAPEPDDESDDLSDGLPQPHKHIRHDASCGAVTAVDPMFATTTDAGPADAVNDGPIFEASPCLVARRDPMRDRMTSRLSTHISTVVLRI